MKSTTDEAAVEKVLRAVKGASAALLEVVLQRHAKNKKEEKEEEEEEEEEEEKEDCSLSFCCGGAIGNRSVVLLGEIFPLRLELLPNSIETTKLKLLLLNVFIRNIV